MYCSLPSAPDRELLLLSFPNDLNPCAVLLAISSRGGTSTLRRNLMNSSHTLAEGRRTFEHFWLVLFSPFVSFRLRNRSHVLRIRTMWNTNFATREHTSPVKRYNKHITHRYDWYEASACDSIGPFPPIVQLLECSPEQAQARNFGIETLPIVLWAHLTYCR